MSARASEVSAVLIRFARYLPRCPRAVYHLSRQDAGVAIRAYAGADFAGCLAARWSTGGGACVCGRRALKHWSITWKT
eukprot:10571478-Alexandrium_andersonii.AAC.1